MKKIIKLSLSVLFTMIVLMILTTNSKAASAKINANEEVEAGKPINISVTGSGVQWNLQLLVDGKEIASNSELENYESNKNINFSKSYTPTSTGKLIIELKGSVTEFSDGSTITNFNSKTVTVTPKTVTNSSGETGGNTGSSTGGNSTGTTNNKPTVTEPKFASASKTVYAKSDVNLRSSWSTSSSAVKVQKGTELRLTGTSTEKVNGYVWYRVTYNGQIKYVAKDYITETKPEEKSGNSNLKILTIEGVELTPAFNENVTEYSAKLVNYTEKQIEVTAQAADEKGKVTVEGNTNIIIGENVIAVKVTAEDGTTKIYTITLTNEEKQALGLKTLKIKDVALKNFTTDKFEYEISFDQNLEKLEIEAIANTEGATVEILGNENLQIGENVITIIVTSADEKETVTYQIKANRLEIVEQQEERKLNIKALLICGVIALVIIVVIVILIVKYVKNNENSNIDYVYNDNLENKESEQEEIENKVNEKKEENEEITEGKIEEQPRKTKVDELFDEYEDETARKRKKGKHSN